MHFPLYRALANEAEAKDQEYVEQFKQGLNIVGPVQRSFRWKEKPGNQELTVSQLDARAWEIRERVVNKLRTNPSQKHIGNIWEATIKDRDAGYCRGPFTHQLQVSQELEDQDWIPTPRFPREQKDKVRPIDDCKDNLINAASKVTEWLELASTDRNVGLIRKLYRKLAAKHGPEKARTMIAGWVLDEADAYRQIGVNPSQRKYAVIALVNPQTGEVNYFIMTGHSFGLVNAVYNYNRRSALINEILKKVFKIPANFFYDDKFGFTIKDHLEQCAKIVQDVHLWLGADFSQKKLQQTTKPVILGVEYNLEDMALEVTPARVKELDLEMAAILKTQRLPTGQAAKLKGKLMFAASQLWGKVGRAFMRALSERQYSKEKRTGLNPAIRGALEAWRNLLRVAPRRRLEQSENDLVDMVIFTDGYFPDARKAETGWGELCSPEKGTSYQSISPWKYQRT